MAGRGYKRGLSSQTAARLRCGLSLQRPIVSVVMAVRDGAAYLDEAVESVLGQTFSDLELVVVDDGSTDRTPEILERFAAGDERVRVRVLAETGGICAARNLGCGEARGRYLACLDADDVAAPERLELQLSVLDRSPQVVLVGGAGVFIDERGAELGRASYQSEPSRAAALLASGSSPVIHSAATMRAGAFRATSGYRPLLRVAHDYDLWLRLSAIGEISNVAEPVVSYRFHTDQVSARDFRRTATEVRVALAAFRERAAGRPDPLEHAVSLDADLLERLGVGPAEVAAQEVDNVLWLARTLAAGGQRERAAPLWRHLARRARATGDRGTRARVLRARAEAESAEGHRARPLAFRAWARLLQSAV